MTTWDGDDYQARFDALASSGKDVHGEATFVRAYLSTPPPVLDVDASGVAFEPPSVLDAGCGTGRVAIELARHGIEVVGVDVDPSMLATAARLAPQITWVESDLCTLDLGRTFDLVLMAGNVPLFTAPGTEGALVRGVARHVSPGGVLVAGFSTDRGLTAEAYDELARANGLELVERFSTWDREPWAPSDTYAVSVHRR